MRILVARLRGASGIATYTRWLVEGLASFGNEVVLLDESSAFESTDPRIEVVDFRAGEAPAGFLDPFRGWSARREVGRRADEFSVDAIHMTNLSLAPKSDRLVITAWDPIPSPVGRYRAAPGRGERKAKEAAHAVVDAVAARRASAIVAVTRAVEEGMSGFGRRTEFIPCFLPDEQIAVRAPERTHDIAIVGHGIDAPRKGLRVALDAVARARDTVPNARLLVIGEWLDPSQRDGLPDFCDVRGPMPSGELREILRHSGCLLIASKWEEFGYSGLEALAAGTPVACGPLPAYDRISGGGVHMARDRSPASLASQIVAALHSDSFEFPRECRSSVAIPKILELYRAVGTGRAPSSSNR